MDTRRESFERCLFAVLLAARAGMHGVQVCVWVWVCVSPGRAGSGAEAARAPSDARFHPKLSPGLRMISAAALAACILWR